MAHSPPPPLSVGVWLLAPQQRRAVAPARLKPLRPPKLAVEERLLMPLLALRVLLKRHPREDFQEEEEEEEDGWLLMAIG